MNAPDRHDFFAEPDLPRPQVGSGAAEAVAREHFGAVGRFREVGSQQDRNFVIDGPAGRFVLKIANPAFSDAELAAQDHALLHLAAAAPDLVIPRPHPARDGGFVARFESGGVALRARLLSFVPGGPLADAAYLAPAVMARLGDLAARVASGLADCRHPGLDRTLQWDIRNTRRVHETLAGHVTDPDRAAILRRAVEDSCDRLDALSPQLRVQPVHGDITDDNVVCEPGRDGRPVPSGVIDFGDVGLGWTVAELATACASLLHHTPTRPLAVLAAVRAFHAVLPLTGSELAALWPAITARTAALVVSGLHQGRIDPGNAYVLRAQEQEWRAFEAALSLPPDVAHAAIRAALGLPVPAAPAPAVRAPLLPGLAAGAPAAVLDLSPLSPDLSDGAWLAPDTEARLAAARPGVAIARYGEARLTRTRLHSTDAPATIALGVEVFCAPGSAVTAPFAGVVRPEATGLVLAGPDADLRLTGLRTPPAPGPLAPGAALGEVGDDGRLYVQLCTLRGTAPPAHATAESALAWLTVCPDPSPLLGQDRMTVPDEPSGAELLRQRDAAVAGVQGHYYDNPPRIERGWRQHLTDLDGRTYLDMINNVASIGHAHPRLTAAVARQWDLLNTNSRFNYRAVSDLAGRLAGLLPDPLDTVFFVNSGSEAVDLALRLAQTFTARKDVIAVAEAYHGWTIGSDAVSTSLADNPRALTTRPDWVHTLLAPNTFRGEFRGPDATARYLADAHRVIDAAVAGGRPPAAFICEALYGNAGGVPLPPGYLPEVYDAVRAAGALCIADEVQVGYGRLGDHFWGFQQQGATPDIVTVAKAMGNGHPLGAVITRRDIADAFAEDGYFFSSAGGSPVSCVVGLTVLDVIEDEGLQANAARTGGHLRRAVEALARELPLIGAVHGMGLYLGIELVRDPGTLEPATEETAAICERLLELGVIVQPTGDHLNVLKIKPPLCLTTESADFFVDALARTLRHGW
ncbi:aminotransferase [Streptomyces sp. NBC_01262]|uniref:aminotransferase n=1 Tax=Streptomyces sp. NBC_01262 TaxID=2903803 RepID=UPI002E32F512|nr:aminotransferase [Streptomyces sp. NBC_01262]